MGQSKAIVSLESESAILGACIREPSIAEIVCTELTTPDFYSLNNQKVFNAILSLSEDNLSPNTASIADRSGVQRTDVEDLVANGQAVSGAAVQALILDIRRSSTLRKIHACCSTAASQIEKSSDPNDILEYIESEVFKVSNGDSSQIADGSEVFQRVLDDFIERAKVGGGPEISTGLEGLDKALVGLRPAKLGIIAARPSMGKTALASTIRRAVLGQEAPQPWLGYGVIEFNLEMAKEELMERELAFQTQINLTKILRAKNVSPEELSRVDSVRGALLSERWYVDDSTYNIAGVRRKARLQHGRMARKGIKTGLVIVDYLQLAGEDGEGRERSIAAVSRGLKQLAKELGCTVLALSQLNRSCEYRDDRRPLMADLRESGAIEQDADWIGFIYREYVYDRNFPPEEAEFIIRKQRSGPIGTVHLRYNPKLVSFSDVPKPATPSDSDITPESITTGT